MKRIWRKIQSLESIQGSHAVINQLEPNQNSFKNLSLLRSFIQDSKNFKFPTVSLQR